MKLKTCFIWTLGVFLGLSSCKEDRSEMQNVGDKGDTYASVSLSLGIDNFRSMAISTESESDDDDKNNYNFKGEWVGNDVIRTVDIYLVGTETGAVVSSGQYEFADFIVENATNDRTVTLSPRKAIKTTAGNKKVYALVNAPQVIREKLATTNKTEFEQRWAEAQEAYAVTVTTASTADEYKTKSQAGISAIASVNSEDKDIIFMSNSQDVTINVEANVSHDDAKNGVKNQAQVPVKRLAARVVVTAENATFEIRNGEKVLGTISNITFSVAQGERKYYIQQKKEGVPLLIKTPAFEQTSLGDKNVMNTHYDYSDLYTKDRAVVTKANGASLSANEIGAVQKPAFLLEATHRTGIKREDAGVITYEGNGFHKGNTAYVLVRAKFTPHDDAWAANNKDEKMADGTFYIGSITGKIYSTKANVTDPAKGGVTGQKYRTYKEGKVLYYAYVNPNNLDRTKVTAAPVFRNNVYHVHISGFKNIGHNWNPLFPEADDPNTNNPKNPDPKPTNPDSPNQPDPNEDPTLPVDPSTPLPSQDTYMSVSISILKWDVHSYSINLDI